MPVGANTTSRRMSSRKGEVFVSALRAVPFWVDRLPSPGWVKGSRITLEQGSPEISHQADDPFQLVAPCSPG